jgi:hypothetical protein
MVDYYFVPALRLTAPQISAREPPIGARQSGAFRFRLQNRYRDNMDTPPTARTFSRWREVAVVASVIWACYALIGGQASSLLLIPLGWLALYSIVMIDRWVEKGTRQN